LKQCIGQLPQAQKDSFLLKEEAGLTVKDIVIILNTSFEASKSRLRYAYENLRQCLHVKTGRTMKCMMTIKMNFLFYWPTKKNQ
jgi:RNA polymerase sigma-70 factor (ECF subfamily)